MEDSQTDFDGAVDECGAAESCSANDHTRVLVRRSYTLEQALMNHCVRALPDREQDGGAAVCVPKRM